jgi:biopolymer transport protein ExbB/TolQ
VLDVTIQREVERLESRLLFLASIGSAGPYIRAAGALVGPAPLAHRGDEQGGEPARRLVVVGAVAIQREVERLESRLLFLASIGSAGPYIGLFGTVFGMCSSRPRST